MITELLGGTYIGLEVKDPPLKANKGLLHGSCNRTACQRPGAIYFNHGTRAYYCEMCAAELNRWNPEGYDGHLLCEIVPQT